MKEKPKLLIDFNEMLNDNLCLLSKEDKKLDLTGKMRHLVEGLEIDVFMEDNDENGISDPLVASGVVEKNTHTGWSSHVKWCIRIDKKGIRRLSEI